MKKDSGLAFLLEVVSIPVLTAGAILAVPLTVLALSLSSCGENTNVSLSSGTTEDGDHKIVYEAMLYDNQGNNFLNFYGNEFQIIPNKVKQWGYDSEGNWSYWYETSSVVTIEVDGDYIQSCGSTVIFKDSRLNLLDIPSELSTRDAEGEGYTVSDTSRPVGTYFGLTHWWYDMKELGQRGSKVVIIQSQDGYNIGAVIGDDVTWEVEEKLPKTTKLVVDDLPMYLHRCNFTIIDADLLKE